MVYAKLFSFMFLVLFFSHVVNAAGPAPVDLGTAGSFAILSKSGISTTGTTSIVGDIGVSPIDSTGITGFGLVMDSSNEFATSSLVTGRVYAADYAPPTPTKMSVAIGDMEIAYTDAAGRTDPTATELGAGDISGMTITPGLYKWGTGVTINTGVTLSGGPNDVWIFQIAQDLAVANGAIITLSGGAQAKNIFWQVAGQATLGTTADFKGIILSQTLVEVNTGATLNGRALAQTAVTLDANAVTAPTGSGETNTTANATATNTTANETTAPTAAPTDSGGSTHNSNFNTGNTTTTNTTAPAAIIAQPTAANNSAPTGNSANAALVPAATIAQQVGGSNRTAPITALAIGSTGLNGNTVALIAGGIAMLLASGLYYYFKVMKK